MNQQLSKGRWLVLAVPVVAGVLVLSTPKPAEGSASVLVPSLAQQAAQIQQVISQFNEYKEMITSKISIWFPDLAGWGEQVEEAKTPEKEHQQAMEEKAVDLAAPEEPAANARKQRTLASLFVKEDGAIDPVEAATITAPPPQAKGFPEAKLDAYASIITREEIVQPLPHSMMTDNTEALNYELERTRFNQLQLLSQTAVKQPNLSAGVVEQIETILNDISKRNMSGMSAADLQALQLVTDLNVSNRLAIEQLRSSLRQERLLGVMLSNQIER